MKDYNLENRQYVISGVAILIITVYIIRLFTLQRSATTTRRTPTPTPS